MVRPTRERRAFVKTTTPTIMAPLSGIRMETRLRPLLSRPGKRSNDGELGKEISMGLAEYMIVAKPQGWTVLHDGTAQNNYDTKEAAFEAAVAAASLAIRQGHEVHVSVPGREAGNKTALGAKDT